MITSVQRIAIKKLIGPKHVKKIHQYFIDNDIRSERREEVYAYGSIRDVYNGLASPIVEAGIWACVRDYIKLRKAEKEAKESLVESINQVVDEPAA